MLSITLKRSAATVGVAAGLLAAAAPACAQVMPGMIGVKAPTKAGTQVGHEGHNAVLIQKHDHQNALTFGLTENEGAAFRGEVTGLEPNALGTQIGSEGVKAPTTPTANGFIIDFAHTDVMARTNAGTEIGFED